jgi:hypothetical protein
MSAVRGIEEGREALVVVLVDPMFEGLVVIVATASPAVGFLLLEAEDSLACENFDEFDLSLEGQLMEHVIAL